jgi:hypothetical protein
MSVDLPTPFAPIMLISWAFQWIVFAISRTISVLVLASKRSLFLNNASISYHFWGKDNKNVAYNQHFLIKMLLARNTFYKIMLSVRNTFATPLQCYS